MDSADVSSKDAREQFLSPSPRRLIDLCVKRILSNALDTADERNVDSIVAHNYQGNLLRTRDVKETGASFRKRKLNKGHQSPTRKSGKVVLAKTVQPAKCDKSCRNRCKSFFTKSCRKQIHSNFWISNNLERQMFYANYVTRVPVKRKRTTAPIPRKHNSFWYYFPQGKKQLRVCRSFFFATLSISQSSVYYFFENNFDSNTGMPKPSNDLIQKVRRHIESFPCINSHHIRADAQRQYLEAGLSIKKMYKLYTEETGRTEPKYNTYRKVFNTEYNLSFYINKKDICDKCCKYDLLAYPTNEETDAHESHKALNKSAEEQKKRDMEMVQHDQTVALVCYDLENVFTLPKGKASNFIYKRKLYLYNLTGYCHLNDTTYCSMWYEGQSGGTGNDIASALIKILNAVLEDNPRVTSFILWSDSCVPQNCHQTTSFALLKFCEDNYQISSIIQRFSFPGHSLVQEVDAVHSVIERHLKHINYHSPVSLLRHLSGMDYDHVKLKLMQMNSTDFFNYSKPCLGINFSTIKFTLATELRYEKQDNFVVKMKTNYNDSEEYQTIPLMVQGNRRRKSRKLCKLPTVRILNVPGIVSKEKIKDIQSMYSSMPNNEDVEFYKAIFKCS